MKIPVYKNVAALMKEHKNENENLLLKMTKLNSSWTQMGDKWTIEDNNKTELFSQLRNYSKAPVNEILDGIYAKNEYIRLALSENGTAVKSMQLPLITPMAVGMGGLNVLENSLTLHHVFGIPYIPGSALKGLTRAVGELKGDPDIKKIFGSLDGEQPNNNERGGVTFFDAYPTMAPVLKMDILTPHYGKYLQDGEVPGEWFEPIPISFLTVDRGAEFIFTMASKESALIDKCMFWLQDGLKHFGIGAKKNVGFGKFMGAESASVGTGGVQKSVTEKCINELLQKNKATKFKRGDKIEAHVESYGAGKITVNIVHTQYWGKQTFDISYCDGEKMHDKLIMVEVRNVTKKGEIMVIKFKCEIT